MSFPEQAKKYLEPECAKSGKKKTDYPWYLPTIDKHCFQRYDQYGVRIFFSTVVVIPVLARYRKLIHLSTRLNSCLRTTAKCLRISSLACARDSMGRLSLSAAPRSLSILTQPMGEPSATAHHINSFKMLIGSPIARPSMGHSLLPMYRPRRLARPLHLPLPRLSHHPEAPADRRHPHGPRLLPRRRPAAPCLRERAF